MTDRNKNRPGYKETKKGWIPDEWDIKPLKEVAFIQTGIAKGTKEVEAPIELPYLRVANVQDGYLDLSEIKIITIAKKKIARYTLEFGDVLFTEGGDFDKLGRGTLWKGEIPLCVHQNHIFAVRTNKETLLPIFLSSLASSHYGKLYFLKCAKQSTNLASINTNQLRRFPALLPPLPEQKAIAEVLSCWDEGIEKLDKLIDAKKLRKKGLMQKLLTGEKRLPGFSGDWKEVRLGDVFEERKETRHNELQLLAITGNRGIIPADEVNKKDSSNSDKSKYKRICPGDLGYNTMRMWQGVSSISSLEGIVSPAYTICIPSKELDPDFVGYLFKTNPVIFRFWRYSQGLVDDTLNLKYQNFAKIHMIIPSTLDEQKAIAEVLETADEEIRLLEVERDALAEQKKGLMQKLLTGEIRCPEFRGEQTNGVKS